MTTPGAALCGGNGTRGGDLDRQREPLPTRVDSLPDLPVAFDDALDAALVGLGVDLGPTVRGTIRDHVRLLLAWNEAINLTAITDPAAVAILHVADSLAALALMRGAPPARLLDLGSGGGFPGLTLAAALPGTHVTLVESVAKKARFLAAAAAAIGLADRVPVLATRAEALGTGEERGRARWDIVTARAVGGLGDLVELALPLLSVGGRLLAWKRGPITAELEAGARAAAALGGDPPVLVPTVLPELREHVIVVVRKREATPPGYPRDPAARRRRPW